MRRTAVAHVLCCSMLVALAAHAGPSATFAPRSDFATGGSPQAVAIGDLNLDGRPDLVVVNYATPTSNSVSVLLGDGGGGFGAKTDYAVGTNPISVAIGDLNGDGKPDLVVTNWSSSNVSVRLGDGAGHFGALANYATSGGRPISGRLADLNGDGKLDVVVADWSNDEVRVMLGDGAGGFGAATAFATGVRPYSLAIADVNGDGKLDVAAADYGGTTVSVLLGNGAGGFGAHTDFAVGTHPISVALADLNGDGKPDLVAANEVDNTVSVLLGNGSGGFGLKTDFPSGSGTFSVAVGDMNLDTKPDLVVANYATNALTVLLGDGAGGFTAQSPPSPGGGPTRVSIGDLNGDGKPDLAVPNALDATVSVVLNTTDNSPAVVLTDAYPVYGTSVRLVFDRAVTAGSATSLLNYSLASFGTISAASMDGSSAVYLTIENGLPRGALETVTVNGITSASSGLSMLSPQSRTFANDVLTAAEVQAADPDVLAGTPCQDRSRFAGLGGAPGVRLSVGATVTAKFATDVHLGDPPNGGVRGGLRVTGVAASVSPGISVVVAGAVVETDGETRLDGPVFVWNTATADQVKPRPTLVPQLRDASCDALGIFNEAEDVEGMSVLLNGMIVVASDPPNRQFWVADTLAAPTESVLVSDPDGVLLSIPLTGDRISVTGVARGTTGGGVEVTKIQSIAVEQFHCEANEDSTFASADWKRHLVWTGGWSDIATWQPVASGGDAGSFMRGAFRADATLELVMLKASYDPSSWNGMCEFEFAADFRYANQWDGFRTTDPPTNVRWCPCIFQDGDTFIGPPQGPDLTRDWQHYYWHDLHGVDFVNPVYASHPNYPLHPDLGPTAKPIELGFFTEASPSSNGGFYPTAYIDMDNVVITACPCQLPDHCVKPVSPITAWWPLDGTGSPVQEVVGSHNGIPSDGVTPIVDGEVAGGLHIGHTASGGAAVVEVPHAADLDMQNNRPFTVETWFRSSNQQSELRALVEKLSGPGSQPVGYQLALYQTRIGFYWYEYYAPYNWWWTPKLPWILDGQWHHIVATMRWYSYQSRTGLSLFVDGVPYISGAMRQLGTISPANTSPLWFGKGRYVPQALEGDLDEVSIYPRSMSDNEILLNYHAGPHGKCKEFCRVPAFRSYCADAETVTVQLEICNHSDFTQSYSWAAQGNAANPARCDANGTGTQFTPGAGMLTLAAGECASVPILVRPPAGVSGHSMCYSVTVDNTLTGWTSSASGVIEALLPNASSPTSWLCATAAPIGPDVFLVGAPHPRLPFDIANNGADAVLARYQVLAMLSSLVDTDPNVTLNGLPPGEAVVDSVLVPARSTYRVWVEPQFFANVPFAPTELVLSLDRAGAGLYEPMQSLLLHPSYAASPNPTAGCTSAPAGLLAWCPFDQVISGTTPELRSGLACTVAGGPPTTSGMVSGALHLGTAAQYVSVAGGASTDVGTGDFSIAAWVRWPSAVSGRRTIVEKRAGSPLAHGFSLYLAASRLGLELADGADSVGVTTFEAPAAVVADNQWHLLTASVARGDSTGGVLRLDGNTLFRFDPRARAGSLTNAGVLRLGQNEALSSAAFDGDVDEVQLFGSALDSLAVAAIATAGPAGECKPVTTGPVTAVTSPGLSESLLLYPNPTWGREGWIRFVVPRAQSVQVRLYDVAGRMVRLLVDGSFEPGAHAVRWEPARVSPGVYFVRARFGGSGHQKVRTVVVVR